MEVVVENLQSLPEQKKSDEEKLKLELELTKEREAWQLQFEELQFKEKRSSDARREEHDAEFQRRKLECDSRLEEQRLLIEKDRIEKESLVKEKEISLTIELEKLKLDKGETTEHIKVTCPSAVKLPRLDFPKYNGEILK